ncbi:hypothetical protein Efla_001266 [Eimeria flavescens]
MQSEFFALTKDGLEVHKVALDSAGAALSVEKLKSLDGVESAEWSPRGDLIALVRSGAQQKLELVDPNTWAAVHTVEGATAVSKFSFSPQGSYLLVCFRYEPNQSPENLRLLEVRSLREVARLSQRAVGDLSWPPLRWTGRESFMCRMVKGALHVFTGESLSSPDFSINNPKFRIPSERGVVCFPSPEKTAPACAKDKESGKGSTSPAVHTPARGPYCAIFSREVKGKPALFEIYELGEEAATCVATKSFFQAQEVDCQWAYDGRAVLVKTHTDASDLTYYGSSALYYLKSDGSYDVRLVAAEEGPVFAAIWSPCTLEFAVCFGKVPSTVAVYDGSSKVSSPKFCLGQGMRTTVDFCPFATLLLWGGFGNLAGEIEVWNLRKKGIVAKTLSSSAICKWAPCGCFFVTANISPRLRVDNRISFFGLSGALLKRVDFACLYSVQFRPLTAEAAAAAAASQKEILETLKVYKSGEAPMAPGAEATGRIGNFASTGRSLSSLTQNKSGGPSPGAYKPPVSRSTAAKLPPGAAEAPGPSSASARSARKRQNRKNRQQEDSWQQQTEESQPVGSEPGNAAAAEEHKGAGETQKAQTKQAASSPSSLEEDCLNSPRNNKGDEELRKKIRAVKKKLTEIERLKQKGDLNEMQQKKVSSEEGLKKDLTDLEAQLKALGF